MKWQVFGVVMSMIISALGLGLIVWQTDPSVASPLLKASFFVALFILTWGGGTLIIFSIKKRLPKPRPLDKTTYESILNDSILLGLSLPILIAAIILIKILF